MNRLKNYTILYVENDTITRLTMKQYLKKKFKTVYEATNGVEALKKFRDNKPDVILLDIYMPYINGLEVTKKIREINETIPIVIITAYTKKELLLEAIELNLTKYIIKPFTKDKLEDMLEVIDKKLKKISHYHTTILLKHRYIFDLKYNTLHDNKDREIHLTKKEIKLIRFLLKSKNQFVDTEAIEYEIWEDLSFEIDCKGRLKSLLNGLRKKIPKDIIKNIYALGYKIEVIECGVADETRTRDSKRLCKNFLR